ncbi:MAG: O-antigen ligase family protein [Planctomycetota bacterium]
MRFSTASLAATLLYASGLWIGEEAADGRGLYLVVLWTVLCAVTAGRELFGVERTRGLRFSIADFAVALVAVGHLISSWHLEQTGGDRRAAWNLTMEWLGLAAAWYTLRTVCRNARDRTLITETLLALIVGLAVQGIWQHHLSFPRQATWYQDRREALDTALRTPGSAAMQRVQEIMVEFSQMGVPLEGSSRVLWENRLLYSTEPLGTFALTNTLAGLLVAGLILATARWTSVQSRIVHQTAIGLTIAAIGYCLVLTKSRSGWLAAICGLLGLWLSSSQRGSFRLMLRAGIAAAGLATVLTVGAACSGAIDREVILESPKSLQYRFFYWLGSLEMLADQPLFGAGPGNFRQAYLPHKPDESSEEIRDPHNYLLEAWSSAGLAGLAGMLLFTGVAAAAIWRQSGEEPGAESGWFPETGPRTSAPPTSPAVNQRARTLAASVPVACIAAGWLLDTGWEWLSADSLRDKAIDLLLLAGVPLLLIRRRLSEFPGSTAARAAATAVLLHLLASGGFGISVVMLTVFCCSAAGLGDAAAGPLSTASPSDLLRRWRIAIRGVIGVLSLLAATATVGMGMVPLMRAERALDKALALAADSRAQTETGVDNVRTAFRDAIAADRRRSGTCQAWAEYELGQLRARLGEPASKSSPTGHGGSEAGMLLSGMAEACDAWIESDPKGFAAWQLRGIGRRLVWEHSGDKVLLQQALDDFGEAVRRHPGQADVWLQKAELEQEAGGASAAWSSAARAETLNQINQAWGHQDQFLSEAQEQRLRLLGQGRGESIGNGGQEIPAARQEAGQKVP